jgi:hypothetical protein
VATGTFLDSGWRFDGIMSYIGRPWTPISFHRSSTNLAKESDMADIRVQVPNEFMDRLRDTLHVKTNPEVIQEALTLLGWAVEERERGRILLSTDKQGGSVEKLAMGSLNAVRPLQSQLLAEGGDPRAMLRGLGQT